MTAGPPLYRCSLRACTGWFGRFHRLCRRTLLSRWSPRRGLRPSPWAPLFCVTGRNGKRTRTAPQPELLPCGCSHVVLLALSRAFTLKICNSIKSQGGPFPLSVFLHPKALSPGTAEKKWKTVLSYKDPHLKGTWQDLLRCPGIHLPKLSKSTRIVLRCPPHTA